MFLLALQIFMSVVNYIVFSLNILSFGVFISKLLYNSFIILTFFMYTFIMSLLISIY